MASAIVTFTTVDGASVRVNPDNVEYLVANTTTSTTRIHFVDKTWIEVSTAIATVESTLESAMEVVLSGGGGGGGVTDHGDLDGLADDDHPQYAQKSNNLSDLASASTARTNLGLGTIATQAANNVSITGGAISGITDLAVADGGTGASDASGARTNLGLVAIASSGSASDLSAGTVPTARLGTGSASSATFLRGDQTWATPVSNSRVIKVFDGTDDLVSTTPEKDTGADSTIAYTTLSTRTHRSGYVITTGTAGGNLVSMWPLSFTMPSTKRFVLRANLGERKTAAQPIIAIAYQDITHFIAISRQAPSNQVQCSVFIRDNESATSETYAANLVIGLNSGYGGEFEATVEFSAVAAGPIGAYSLLAYGAGTTNSARNSFVGTNNGAALDASWASGSELTVAIGVQQLTASSTTVEISDLVILKHPLDE